MSALHLIKQQIKTHGPISIHQFMEIALFDPDFGYYTQKQPFGRQGDFITAPEISQVFGELIGIWCASIWHSMEKPKDIIVAEIGPGRGTLMADFLRGTSHIEGFHQALSVHMVETSPTLTTIQKNTLNNRSNLCTWHTTIDSLPKKPMLLIANELFDALPIHQSIVRNHTWFERCIGLTPQGQLEFTYGKVQQAAPNLANGTIKETSPTSLDLMEKISNHIAHYGGGALIIDYGYEDSAYGDTLQAVHHHRYASVLENIGNQDITAHIDFNALRKIAKEKALSTYLTTQGQFLSALGIELRTAQLQQNAPLTQQTQLTSSKDRLVSPQEMGTLFKVLAITSSHLPPPIGF